MHGVGHAAFHYVARAAPGGGGYGACAPFRPRAFALGEGGKQRMERACMAAPSAEHAYKCAQGMAAGYRTRTRTLTLPRTRTLTRTLTLTPTPAPTPTITLTRRVPLLLHAPADAAAGRGDRGRGGGR